MNETRTDKFTVSVEKVVNLGNFESIRVGLAEVLDLNAETPETAYNRILQQVNSWTAELKPVKPAGPVTQPVKAEKPSGPVVGVTMSSEAITTEDRYQSLAWVQSQKKNTLSTVVLTPELLQNPVASDLYSKLKMVGSMKVAGTTYKLSEFAGKTFLQKWKAAQLG